MTVKRTSCTWRWAIRRPRAISMRLPRAVTCATTRTVRSSGSRSSTPAELKLPLYTPNLEEHGWESPHSVVETVVDDMPFLVDSISMEISRHGRSIHLVIRPIMLITRDDEGRLQHVGDGNPESLIHVELDRLADP